MPEFFRTEGGKTAIVAQICDGRSTLFLTTAAHIIFWDILMGGPTGSPPYVGILVEKNADDTGVIF